MHLYHSYILSSEKNNRYHNCIIDILIQIHRQSLNWPFQHSVHLLTTNIELLGCNKVKNRHLPLNNKKQAVQEEIIFLLTQLLLLAHQIINSLGRFYVNKRNNII